MDDTTAIDDTTDVDTNGGTLDVTSAEGATANEDTASAGTTGSDSSVGATDSSETETAPKSWSDSLPEELRNNPNILKHKSVESLAKGYVEAVKKIGEKGFTPLPRDATPEQRAAYNAIRRGADIKSPNDYSFEQGNDDVDILELKQALFDAGADDYMANEVFNRMDLQVRAEEANRERLINKQTAIEADKLRSEWGENYQVNLKANEILLNKYPEAARVLRAVSADKVAAVQMMLTDLNMRAADSQIKVSHAKAATYEDNLKRIEDSAAYKDRNDPNHNKAALERAQLIMARVNSLREGN